MKDRYADEYTRSELHARVADLERVLREVELVGRWVYSTAHEIVALTQLGASGEPLHPLITELGEYLGYDYANCKRHNPTWTSVSDNMDPDARSFVGECRRCRAAICKVGVNGKIESADRVLSVALDAARALLTEDRPAVTEEEK